MNFLANNFLKSSIIIMFKIIISIDQARFGSVISSWF